MSRTNAMNQRGMTAPWKAWAVAGLLAVTSLAVAQPEESKAEPAKTEVAKASPAMDTLSLKDSDLVVGEGLVAKYKNRDTVSQIVTYRRPPDARNLTPEGVKELDDKAYNDLASHLAIEEVLYDTAMKQNFVDQNEDVKSRLDEMKDRLLIYMYYQKSPAANVKVTEEDMKAHYEANKKDYYRPYQFSMRHIFLSTYVSHTAQDDETLEGLAESISKDKDMVAFILSDDDKKEARWVPPADREEKLFKPLQPGEKLLVPMSKEEKEKVRAKIAGIKKQLDEGADFETAAKEFSETEQKGVKIGPLRPEMEEEKGKPILPEILSAIEKTESGKITDIVQTKHGFQIYKVEDKEPARTLPFEEVKASLERSLSAKKSEEAVNAMYMDLTKKAWDSLKINRELLTAESPAPSEILVSSGDDLNVTMQVFMSQNREYKDKFKTDDELIGALIKLRPFNTWLLTKAAIAEGLANSADYKTALHEVHIGIVAPEFMNSVVHNSITISDEKLKKQYEENKDRYKVPEQADLYLIGRKISDTYASMSDDEKEKAKAEALASLGEKVKAVKTFDDFKKLAAEYSDDPSKDKEGSVGEVPMTFRNGFGGALGKLEAGKMSEPVAYGNSVYVLWIKEKKPESIRKFEDVTDLVENHYRIASTGQLAEKLREIIIIRAGLDKAFGATADTGLNREVPK